MRVIRYMRAFRGAEQLQVVEDTVNVESAIDGLQDKPGILRRLEAGDVVRQSHSLAGIRFELTLTPAHAVNRTAVQRLSVKPFAPSQHPQTKDLRGGTRLNILA